MSIKVRFAPSPTGFLHVGNVRTALVNWLFARKTGGEFILRIDDTDKERSEDKFKNAIIEDLEWLGIFDKKTDSVIAQSSRFDRYEIARKKLLESRRLYACYETPEELDVQRKMLASRGLPPIYKRPADEQKKKYEAEGRKPHFRFLLNDEEIAWDDLIRGHTHFKATHMSDPVLLREDGVPVYTLASVVDDGEMNITHVIRGEDHVSNTAVQVQLYKALGFAVPQFAHMALLKTKDGEMSKRLGGNDIRALREAGILPMAVNSLLARIGTSDAVEPFAHMTALAEGFDFKKFGRAPANYDVAELERINIKIFRMLSREEVLRQIATIPNLQSVVGQFTPEFWDRIKSNVKSINDLKDWLEICFKYTYQRQRLLQYAPLLLVAAEALEQDIPRDSVWDEATWKLWIHKIQERYLQKHQTAIKGKELYMPLRLALTNREDGPELKDVFLFLGRHGSTSNQIITRLRGVQQQMQWKGGETI